MHKRYTVEEIRKYILAQESMGDILYFLNEDNIDKANEPKEENDENFFL
jgi:hypothetical protein